MKWKHLPEISSCIIFLRACDSEEILKIYLKIFVLIIHSAGFKEPIIFEDNLTKA